MRRLRLVLGTELSVKNKPKVSNCAGVYRLEHNYIVRYIKNISATCFGPYGHLQVGYEIRLKNYI